ncbi:telomere-associated protein RIF1 [Caerostris extrusa]|uniref:Telomere-associated protein RIF1 n=1 Tax=Caerostris extrusa TaxID=172846 RepID=A0AAV4MCD3_CAEEX|nr:telomere-associated protein RIF1 [Caerostris extrusa]
MKENSPELSENTSKKNIVSNDDVKNNKEQNDTAVNKEKLDQLSNLKPDLSSGKDNIKQSCQSSSELLVSQVIIRNETPNMDVNIKEKEETTLGNKLPGSQRTTNKSMIKPKKESHGKNPVLYKKNGKSKGNTITMHLKPNSSKASSEKHNHNNLDVKHMETLLSTETASSKSENHSIQPNADQVCVEVTDLSDSEDIIPSSQSSGDSMSHVKLPAIEMSPKDPNECPETPTDLIETADKDLDEISCQASVLAAKNSITMPLKSSENLVVSDEHINRPGIKCTLSDVLLETNEDKKMLIVENTPPSFTGAYNVQTEDPLILLDNLSAVKVEEKVKTIVDNKITGSELNLSNTIENVLKEDSPKTVRIKSLRSSAKNAARKSLNTVSSKKVSKKIEKRKSMPNLNTSKKCEFDAAIKNTNNEILSDFNKLISSKESSRSCENNLTSENQSEKISHPSSPEMSAEIEQNSILDDINHVLLDIHDKIESYNDVFSLELGVDEKIEVKQDANNLLSSEQHNANKQENLEQKIENGNISDIRLVIGKIVKEVELCGTNNSELTIQDQNHIDSSSVYEKSENSKIENSSMNIEAKENTLVTENLSKEKVSSCSNISLTNEASFNEIHSVNDISCNNLAFASVTSTENLESSSLKVENKKFRHLMHQDLDTHSQEIERELYKIEIIEKDAVIEAPTEYVETCQISEKVISHEKTSDFQIKIVSVASVEEKYVNDSESLNKSIVADEVLDKIKSSVKILANEDSNNFSSAEKSQESTKHNALSEIDNISEKFNGKDEVSSFVNGETKNLNSLENHEEICKIIQDSCSSGIEEIQETCEIADYRCLLLKSEEGDILKSSSLNFPEVGMTENVNINADNSNITKERGNDVSHSDEHSDNYKNKYIERFDKKGNLTKNVFCEASETSTESNQKLKLQLHSSSPSKEDKEMQVTTASFKSMDSVAAQCDLECYDEEEEEAVNDKIVDSSLSKNFYTQSDKQIEGSSRKRKTKCPVRSPFNFRQRSNILVSSNKSSVKDNGQNTPKITNKNSKKVMHDMQKKMPEVTGKKFKRHIEPKISINESSNKAEIDNQNASNSSDGLNVEIKQGSAKRLKVECDLQEITDKKIIFLQLNIILHALKTAQIPLNLFVSILKKRKASSDLASLKIRKVTFANPLVEERLFNKNDDLSQRILIVNGQVNNREQQTSNTSQDIEKAEKTSSPSMDENPSSSEYENSEETLTDYYAHPICPSLVNCEDSINCIVKDLTTPAWVPGLLTLFNSKNIKTIGDLCKLNPHELKDLPIKSPKVLYLHKALIAHIRHTQEAALKKIKMLGDSDLVEDEIEEASKDKPQPEILKCSVNELANGDKIGQLPTQTLIELSNICFQEVTKRLADQ